MTFSEKLEDNRLFLVLSDASRLKKTNIEIVRELAGIGYHTIVITSNQPYSILMKAYEKNGINTEKVFVVDAITRYALGKEPQNTKNCKFINTPGNLTDIGIAVSDILANKEDVDTCVVFDSVSTMLIYISSTNLSKFIHFITNKLRLLDVAGIFMAVEKGLDPGLLIQLKTFVDTVIEIKEENP